MRPKLSDPPHRRIVLAASALLAAIVLIAAAATPGSTGAATAAKARSCKDVVVQFEPEGSGGATKIRVKHIRCSPARKVLRKCINGKLKPGWSGSFADNKFRLRKNRKRIRYLPVGGGGCIPVARGATAPSPPTGANRVETFKPKLDGDQKSDRVYVYNLPTDGSPATYFQTWTKEQGTWKLRQQKLVNEIPSLDPSAGLVEGWVSDLNRDGRKEIAVRDFFTPSYGEVLSIFRQKSKHSPKFEKLQSIGGDRAVVKKKKHGKPAVISVFRKDIHSPDNVEHHEKWKWSKQADKWRCKKDCAPLAG